MIFNHESKAYIAKRNLLGAGRWNGAYYYSKEITENIIPNVKTDRNWILVNVEGQGYDHSIVFIHNNLNTEKYNWLKQYKDLVLVCGVPETVDKVKHLGHAIYLPLSIDTEYVLKYRTDKPKKGAAYVGRKSKAKDCTLPNGISFVSGLPREELLKRLDRFETVYAVGRIAIEAKCLNPDVIIAPCDPRYPDPSIWKVLDNKDAAKLLQKELDKIDAPKEKKEPKEKKSSGKGRKKKQTKKAKEAEPAAEE